MSGESKYQEGNCPRVDVRDPYNTGHILFRVLLRPFPGHHMSRIFNIHNFVNTDTQFDPEHTSIDTYNDIAIVFLSINS